MRRLSFLGDSSYSLYLLHMLLMDVALVSLAYAIPPFGRVILDLGIAGVIVVCAVLSLACVAISHVCYHGIERRIVISLQAVLKRRHRPAPSGRTN